MTREIKLSGFELCKITTRRGRFLLAAFLFLACTVFNPANALVNPDEQLANPVLEARARDISQIIRCPVCESQNIEDSNADVARDLRLLIRERLVAGDSDEQIVEYLRIRYGDSIVMKPPLNTGTGLLWLGPFIVLTLGGLAAFQVIRKANKA